MRSAATLGLMAALLAFAPAAAETPSPAGAKVYFISPTDGATVTSPFVVRFGLSGMGVAPAGVDKPNTGHHHLVIDADAPAAGEAVPLDAQHLHFGGGQTETTLTLPPGRHTLRLVFADWSHIPFKPPVMSDPITITVK